MATVTNIKNALSFDNSDVFNLGPKTVGDASIARMKAWFENQHLTELDGREATANDFAAYMWLHVRGQVKNYERRVAEASVTSPSEFEDA